MTRVVLVGAHGHGREHLARLHAGGRARLVGVADPRPLDAEQRALIGDAIYGPDAATIIAATEPDVVVIVTPVHTHVDLATTAMRAGAHLLLEKPATPGLDGLDRLLAVQRETGRVVQVGFQAFGSGAFTALTRQIVDGRLGEIEAIGATGLWWRGQAYWDRSGWAGRRLLNGHVVNDGALTNPFAHAVALALRLAGDPVRRVELDTYRTRAAEAHDTASARIHTARGVTITVAVTLCAEPESEPVVTVHGSRGRAELHYTQDRQPRTDLLDNLLDHLADPAVDLLVPLAGTRAFTQVAEAVRLSPPPVEVAQRDLAGLPETTRLAAATGRLYCETGAAWARATPFTWTPEGTP